MFALVNREISSKQGKAMRKIVAVVSSCVLLLALAPLSGCGNAQTPEEAFNAEVQRIQIQEASLNSAIDSAELLENSGAISTDEGDIAYLSLETAVSTGKAAMIALPEMPTEEADINAATEELKAIDYSAQVTAVTDALAAAEAGFVQQKLSTVPTQDDVLACLATVADIQETEAATEDYDPNMRLNDDGSYISEIFFSSPLVDQSEFDDKTVSEAGTEGGGCVEVYVTEEDTANRVDYLANYDGGPLDSGSHTAYGVVVVRTSAKLASVQQKALEASTVTALVVGL